MLAIAAAKLGFGPVVACDHEPAALEAARANARANGVELELRRANLRLEPPPQAPTVVANLTAPILREVARRLERAPERLICSGLLAAEAEDARGAFAEHGLTERLSRAEGDWIATLQLRRPKSGMSEPRASLPIAVFDSGIGGLTVLHELLVSLPHESYLYLGDTAGFPYGTKPLDWLRPRIAQSTRFLLDRGSKLLVVACNSATSAGAGPGREVAERARGGGADRGRPRGGDRGGDQRQRPDRGARHARPRCRGAPTVAPSRPRGASSR